MERRRGAGQWTSKSDLETRNAVGRTIAILIGFSRGCKIHGMLKVQPRRTASARSKTGFKHFISVADLTAGGSRTQHSGSRGGLEFSTCAPEYGCEKPELTRQLVKDFHWSCIGRETCAELPAEQFARAPIPCLRLT